jgi:subtilisin family serine protease
VGPGEKILSCRSSSDPKRSPSRDKGKSLDELYVALSGTSMAAPHISGLLAAFLSVRTEFIGYPDRVKRILLEHCTDLQRDRYHQGAGLPNLSKMLLET